MVAKKKPAKSAPKKPVKKAVKAHRIEDDTAILPWVVAETVIGEVSGYLHRRGESGLSEKLYAARDEITDRLAARADVIYAANARFRKQIQASGNRGRDQLYVFMRHWLASDLKKHMPAAYRALPAEFANGEELPRR